MHEAHDVVYAQFLCALDRAVSGAVVDDEVLYLIYAVDVAREVADSYIKCFCLVVAGYLEGGFSDERASACAHAHEVQQEHRL